MASAITIPRNADPANPRRQQPNEKAPPKKQEDIWPDAFGAPNPPTPWLPFFETSGTAYSDPITPFFIGAPEISGTSYSPATISPSSYSAATIEAAQAPLYTLGPSQFESLRVDPTGRQAQLQMLAEMQRAYSSGGLDEVSRAQLEDVLLAQRQAQTAGSAGAWQEAQRRGLSTSATALAASLFSSQKAAQTAAEQSLQVGALAEQRRNTLRGDIAGLGGNIYQQDYTMAADRAKAVDAINRFNIENKQQWAEAAATREQQTRSFNANAINEENRFKADQAQKASAFNAGEANTANRFAAQTAFEAANANASRQLAAAQDNARRSFEAEEYNSSRAWSIAGANKNIDWQNQQAKESDYWKTWGATQDEYWRERQNPKPGPSADQTHPATPVAQPTFPAYTPPARQGGVFS